MGWRRFNAGGQLGPVTSTYRHDIDPAQRGFGDFLGQTVTANGTDVRPSNDGYDDAGRIVRWLETVDGVSSDRTFDYDDAGRLVGVRDTSSGNPLATYAFDGNGNRTRVLDLRAGAGAQDVELGRNLGCDDGLGGVMNRAATAEDQLCRYGDHTYTYDDSGRLSARTNTVTSQSLHLRYDAAGQLREATNEAGQTVHYVLDPQGRRVGRVVSGTLQRGWIYGSALAPIAEVNAAGQVTQTYVYGSRLNVPDFIVQADGDVYRIVHDHLGSPRLTLDARTGAIVHRMRFDEWGVLVEESGDTTLHPFGYAGGLYDQTTGLTRFGARDYDPVVGRWTAKDPLRFEARGQNFYAANVNDTVNYQDPSGKNPVAWLLLAAAVLFLEDDGPSGDPHGSELYDTKNEAGSRTSHLPGQLGGLGDAVRHCLASCEIARDYGAAVAESCGDAWESFDFPPAGDMEREQDLHNNEVGRRIGASSKDDCMEACMRSSDLRTYSDDEVNDGFFR